MKRYLIGLSLAVCSCQQAAEMPTPEDDTTTRAVTIVLSDNTETSSSDLIAVQLYSIKDNAINVYGYGLFDSYDFPSVELLTYQSYYFAVSIVADAQNIISYNETDSGREYYKPFSQYGVQPMLADCEFHYSTSISFGYINSGVARIAKDATNIEYSHPSLERWVGYSEIFTPSDESENIAVELKMVYGSVRLTAEGLDEGTLTFKFSGAPDIVLTPEERSVTAPLCLTGTSTGSSEWTEDNYSEEVTYSVVYATDRGVETIFYEDGVMNLVRAKTQPITVQSSLPVDFTISVETGELEDLPEIIL